MMEQKKSEIDYNSGMPLYLQLKDIIKNDIISGKYTHGEKIPTEEDYCKEFSVSRITVRQAINFLVQEKLLVRKQGKGTFVASMKMEHHLPKLYSFTEDMIAQGRTPDSIVLNSVIIEAEEDIAKQLELPENNRKVLKLTRVRCADEVPVLIETAFIPDYLCPGLSKYDFAERSLYRILKNDYKFIFKYAVERYEISSLDQNSAALLESTINEPAFTIHRVAYLENDKPYELTQAIGKGDAMSFTVTLFPETKFKRNY